MRRERLPCGWGTAAILIRKAPIEMGKAPIPVGEVPIRDAACPSGSAALPFRVETRPRIPALP